MFPNRSTFLAAMGCAILCSATTAEAGQYQEIYRFAGGAEGSIPAPMASVVIGANGHVYGTTLGGGLASDCETCGYGTVFELVPPDARHPNWRHTVLYAFKGGEDGLAPRQLAFGTDGALYGATTYGGIGGETPYYSGFPCCGTVYRLSPPGPGLASWVKTTLYRFTGHADGGEPTAGVVVDTAGHVFGTTSQGFGYGNPESYGNPGSEGAVYELTPPAVAGGRWTETVLHSFPERSSDGGFPLGTVTLGNDSKVYGSTEYGGTFHQGTVFRLRPPSQSTGHWTEEILHSFEGAYSAPNNTLVLSARGRIYGTTSGALDQNLYGSDRPSASAPQLFVLVPPTDGTTTWTHFRLHRWQMENFPLGDITHSASDDSIIGTNHTADGGTIYRIAPTASGAWTKTDLYRFGADEGAAGFNPNGITRDAQGRLFGTVGCADAQDAYGIGAVFMFDPR